MHVIYNKNLSIIFSPLFAGFVLFNISSYGISVLNATAENISYTLYFININNLQT